MDVVVRLFASLRERAGTGELVLEGLPEVLDVTGLKRELLARHPDLGDLGHVRGVIGTRYVADDTPLDGAREVAFLPPVSGGMGEAEVVRGVFELSTEPLDPAACQARVSHASCGAAVVFTGTTRDTNRGKEVRELDYEAFEAMSGPQMARIFEVCVQRFGGDGDPELALRMLCQHRVGVVGVGEPSVVIAVASPHRAAAFEACRFLIDTLKEELPVWKKEVYGDGHQWIGDRS